MKIDKKYLKFPQTLSNDLEGFLRFYPYKFPPIISYYESVVKNVFDNPKKFRKYGDWAQKELLVGFAKIKKDYGNGDKNDLEFLVSIDQRFNKLICYRFWIVNYLFSDGPLHEFFISNLKRLIYKIVDVGNDAEDFEEKISSLQRDLIQTDYADLYLLDSFGGQKILEILSKDPEIKKLLNRAIILIDENVDKNEKKINLIWDKVYNIIQRKDFKVLKEKLLLTPIEQTKMRGGDRTLIYNALTHAVEFRKGNKKLIERHALMKKKIRRIKFEAKKKLNKKEYELFVLSYEQVKNLAMYKDVMGMIDPVLLPLWLGEIQVKMKKLLKKQGIKFIDEPTGHAGTFYFFVWYLPDELKAKVMTPDLTDFDLKTI